MADGNSETQVVMANSISVSCNYTAVALHKVTFVWKNIQDDGYSFDSCFSASWLHAWKNSDNLELYNIEKIVRRKEYRMVQNTKLLKS